MNDLSIQVYSSGTTPITDSDSELKDAEGLYFETGYPGGLYLSGGFFVSRIPTNWWEVKPPLRCVIRSGLDVVFEGLIPSLRHIHSEGDSGVYVPLMGYWGYNMTNRVLRKRWADDRTDEQTWQYRVAASAADKCTVDRRSRIYFLPKAEAWGNTQRANVHYAMPTSEVIKGISFDYNLTGVAGEDWDLILYDFDNSSAIVTINQAGAGSSTGTTAYWSTADFGVTNALQFRFEANGVQTPTSDGSTFCKIANLMVYSEDESTGDSICLKSICEDIISNFSSFLNSDTNQLTQQGSVRVLEPYITSGDGYEILSDIVMRAAGYGDGDDDPWAVYIDHSEKAATPDGKGVLTMEEYPDVTAGYDYIVRLGDDNLVGSVELEHDYVNELMNDAVIVFRNAEGFQYFDLASDSDSQTDNGVRSAVYNIGNSTATKAGNFADRLVDRHKDPKWLVKSAINVRGWVEGANGEVIPASRIRAGKRLKIDGYGDDSHLISRTRYDDESQVCSINVGQLPAEIFQESVFAPVWDDPSPLDHKPSSGSSSRKNVPWWRRMDLIGPRGRARMRKEGTWADFKKKNAPWIKK